MSDIEDRLLELEQHTERLIFAGDPRDQGGWGAWSNHLETRLLQERNFLTDVVAHALASFRNDLIDQCKVLIQQALVQRIRGTFSETETYAANDVVAHNGASFISRRDNPGACPGSGWQMIAAQGKRGVAGERGEPGKDAPVLQKWLVNRSDFTATPIFSDGRFGPVLDLSELFESTP
jgi:hypothetical protein